jgi:uncharacterized protein (UPF0128 family)
MFLVFKLVYSIYSQETSYQLVNTVIQILCNTNFQKQHKKKSVPIQGCSLPRQVIVKVAEKNRLLQSRTTSQMIFYTIILIDIIIELLFNNVTINTL